MGESMTRLADIAARAGVSQATVSRVLNSKPGVAPATRQRVVTALDAIGYQRPVPARARSAGLVGLIVPELTNPVFPAFAQAVETSFAHAGYTSVLCTQTRGGVHEDTYTAMLLERGVAGIVFICGLHADLTADVSRYRLLQERGMPIVTVNGYRPGIEAPSVSVDDTAAMHLAVRHLAQLGHRRPGLVVGPEHYVTTARKVAGFRAAVRAVLGYEVSDSAITYPGFGLGAGGEGGRLLVERGCTALVCGSDVMALGAMSALRRRGLEIPADVSVIGSDDSLLMAHTDPPLSTVRMPVEAMADAAVQALLGQLTGARPPVADYVFRPEAVVRGSTGPVSRRTVLNGFQADACRGPRRV